MLLVVLNCLRVELLHSVHVNARRNRRRWRHRVLHHLFFAMLIACFLFGRRRVWRSIFILLWTPSLLFCRIFFVAITVQVFVGFPLLWSWNLLAVLTSNFLRPAALLLVWICHHHLASLYRCKCNRLIFQLGFRAYLTIFWIIENIIRLLVFWHQAIQIISKLLQRCVEWHFISCSW